MPQNKQEPVTSFELRAPSLSESPSDENTLNLMLPASAVSQASQPETNYRSSYPDRQGAALDATQRTKEISVCEAASSFLTRPTLHL